MRHLTAQASRRRSRGKWYALFLTGACLALQPWGVHALTVPAGLEVPAGNRAFLTGRAFGTQNYICLPSAAGFAWSFLAPQATLFNLEGTQITTHFLSPNPDEAGTPRATWQHSRDTSSVWAMAIASSSDPAFVEAGAIPWLLLQAVGTEPGPDGGQRLAVTTYIHRVNTIGGLAPATGCAAAADVGKRVLVPYEADYVFYRAPRRE
jgi:hypothetical protein